MPIALPWKTITKGDNKKIKQAMMTLQGMADHRFTRKWRPKVNKTKPA